MKVLVLIYFYGGEVSRTCSIILRCAASLYAENESDFDEYTAGIMELSLYDTGQSATYGDQLLTLVTCAYHTENGQFVVVARKK